MASIETTLAERGARYGAFLGHAAITQALKSIARGTLLDDLQDENFVKDLEAALEPLKAKWPTLRCDVREGLEMNFHKVGRVLNGDPEYADNFVDVGGYSKLVADRQEKEQTVVEEPVRRAIGRPRKSAESSDPRPRMRKDPPRTAVEAERITRAPRVLTAQPRTAGGKSGA